MFSTNITLQIVMLGTCLIGCISGALGSFAVLRRQSLLGDAMAHAALPGIAIAFIITQTKSTVPLMIGAVVAGWIGTMIMNLIHRHTQLKQDTALGIILSVFFGLGLVLMTYIQKLPTPEKSGLNTFLFGRASTLLWADIQVMIALSILVMIILGLFWKEFKVMTFDPEFSKVIGVSYVTLEMVLTTAIVLAIVMGLQAVGVVLMSAMLIAPAVAARQWTEKLSSMLGISAAFGAISGMTGALISANLDKMPTGPIIVVVMSVIVAISLFFAPNRGLVWEWAKQKRDKVKFKGETRHGN